VEGPAHDRAHAAARLGGALRAQVSHNVKTGVVVPLLAKFFAGDRTAPALIP
jgi:hypothetical protein